MVVGGEALWFVEHWSSAERNEDTVPSQLNGNSKKQRDFVLPSHISLFFFKFFQQKPLCMMFSIQEIEKSLPAAPKILSQSKESERARTQTHWRRT